MLSGLELGDRRKVSLLGERGFELGTEELTPEWMFTYVRSPDVIFVLEG